MFFHQISYNVSAMVSTGLEGTVLSIKHLAKTFYFVLSFLFKAKSKDLADFIESFTLWVKH